MKAFTVVVLSVTFAVFTKQQTTLDPAFLDNLHANQAACAKENGVQVSDAVKIWTDPDYPANNPALKCYYKCMCTKLGIIDNGKLDNVDTMKFFAHYDSPTELKEIGDECTDTPTNSDLCEYAFQLFNCIAKAELD